MTAADELRLVVPFAACLGLAVASCALYKKISNPQQKSKKFEERGKIKNIFIYPIKSLPPIEVNHAEVTLDGLKFKEFKDREFMLLNSDNEFLTARAEPTLLLLSVSYNEQKGCLEISPRDPGNNLKTIEVSLNRNNETGKEITVSTWNADYPYRAIQHDPKVSEWFSEYLNRPVILVRFVAQDNKQLKDVPSRFQDTAELNILSEQSVANLVDLIHDPAANISHRNFRPSLLVDTKYPYDEDFWNRVKIGDVETEFQRRCDRCILTTINPDSGIQTHKEPLITLRKYRVDRSDAGITKYKFRPLFSSHHVILTPGTIHVGESIMADKAHRELL